MTRFFSTFSIALVPLAGCLSVDLPDHCVNNLGDRSCGEGQFCSRCTEDNNGCVEEQPVSRCYVPGDEMGGGSSSSGDGSETASGSTDTGPTVTTGSTDTGMTTGPDTCEGPEDCTPAAPFCDDSGECVTCDGVPVGACEQLDAATPVCAAGECVQCSAGDDAACEGTTPLCEGNVCVGCSDHDQCGEAACNLFTGACLPASAVAHAGPGQEFATLTAAVGSFGGNEGTVIVHGGASFDESATVEEGDTIAFVANVGSLPIWLRSGSTTPQLTVNGTALLDGLQLSGNSNAVGAHVSGGQLWLDRSRVVQNTGGGLLADNGAELVVRNCFVGGASSVDAAVIDMSTAEFIYTTLVGADGGLGEARALACNSGSAVEVRNSVLASVDDVPEMACASADVSTTASETKTPGDGNATLGGLQADWFVDVNTGDFHLDTPPAAVSNTATWQAGDPLTDIDGDPRPSTEGAPDYAGADVPQ